jgi:hypothetical protein
MTFQSHCIFESARQAGLILHSTNSSGECVHRYMRSDQHASDFNKPSRYHVPPRKVLPLFCFFLKEKKFSLFPIYTHICSVRLNVTKIAYYRDENRIERYLPAQPAF